MQFESVWKQLLSEGEHIEHEFTIADSYRLWGLIGFGIISLPLLLAYGLGVVVFAGAFFYFGYYLKIANAYALTNRRIIIQTGWLTKTTVSVEYQKITDTRIFEPFWERLLTYTGELKINTAGSSAHEIIVRHILNPHEVKKRIDALKTAATRSVN